MNAVQAAEIEATAANLALTAKVAYDPQTAPEARQQAINYLYSFQQTTESKLQVAVGLQLICSNSPAVTGNGMISAFLGLQLIQHCATYQWAQLDQAARNEVKTTIMQVVVNGNNSISTSPTLLLEALAKVLTEIAKKEWPQLWPEFFPFLMSLITTDKKQIAIFVLRRLCEDVFSLQNISNSERRRDLSQSLQMTSADVLNALFKLLAAEVPQDSILVIVNDANLVKLILNCIASYGEFADCSYLTKDGRTNLILRLFRNREVRLEASNCFQEMLDRKVSTRKDDLGLLLATTFEGDGYAYFSEAIRESTAIVAQSEEDEEYIKRMDNILVNIAGWSSISSGADKLISLLQVLASCEGTIRTVNAVKAAYNFVHTFPKSVMLERHQNVAQALISLLRTVINRHFLKVGPSKGVFDEDMSALRAEFSKLIRQFGKFEKDLYNLISEVIREIIPKNPQKSAVENLAFLQNHFVSTVLPDREAIVLAGINDLLLYYQVFMAAVDLDLRSALLSGISANFRFLAILKEKNALLPVHSKLLADIAQSIMATYSIPNEGPGAGLRRHATALTQSLVTRYPDVMNLVSDTIVLNFTSSLKELSNLEYCGLIEVMLLLSNMWEFNKQQELLKAIMGEIEWSQLIDITTSEEVFANFLLQQDTVRQKTIHKSVNVLQAVVCRLKNRIAPDGTNRHPGMELVMQIIPCVFSLVKNLHGLLSHPTLNYALNMRPSEKNMILGVSSGDSSTEGTERSEKERIQNMALNYHDLSLAIVGEACARFAPNIYQTQKFAEVFLNFTCYNLQRLNNFRLRQYVRCVFKPLILSCPKEMFETIAKPFFQQFGPFMFNHLRNSWISLNCEGDSSSPSESSNGDQPAVESLENEVTRLLIKEYLDILLKILEHNHEDAISLSNGNASFNDEQMEGDVEIDLVAKPLTKRPSLTDAGQLGTCLLRDPSGFSSIVHLSALALTWKDSTISFRATRILHLSWTFISSTSDMNTMQNILIESLKAAVLWVEVEHNFDAIHKLVDKIINTVRDAVMTQTLNAWNVPQEDVVKMYALFNENKAEKKRKDLFVRWTRNNQMLVNGKDLKVQWLKGLPSLESLLKPKDSDKEGKDQVSFQKQATDLDLKSLFS